MRTSGGNTVGVEPVQDAFADPDPPGNACVHVTSADVFLCHLRLRSYSNQRPAHFLFRYRYIVIGAKTTMSIAHDKSNQPI